MMTMRQIFRQIAPRDAGCGRLRQRRGFTLVEAMIACTVLAISVIAIGSSMTASVRQSAVIEEDSTSLLLARQLVEEIAAKPFLDPDTGTTSSRESSRSLYDNVGDYDGYKDTVSAASPVTSLQGKTAAVTNNRTYTRAVTVEFRTSPAGSAVTTGDFALITVTVTAPTGRTVQIWRMATNTTFMQSN
ncbi:MAG TPA: prepilin-type N-terminal cleavage/methylation domain-containing protein [Tepidisphaeraceae bacterium]|jgi:Tfp pilus assembly protein PilV|nr:prepilin-type N-terminal cleavage/methylation domain-containing protein [Tepidisphaeraceae bacterium]